MPENEEQLFEEEVEEGAPEYSGPVTTVDDRDVFTTPSDPDVETILGRISSETVVLRPRFQRASVWDDKRKSRLIESLVLNLPIPPVFLAEDENGTRVVVDGQQ